MMKHSGEPSARIKSPASFSGSVYPDYYAVRHTPNITMPSPAEAKGISQVDTRKAWAAI
jgi:hypothetical protein